MKSFFRDDELEFWSNHLVEWQIVWAKDPKDRTKSDIKEKLWSFLWLPVVCKRLSERPGPQKRVTHGDVRLQNRVTKGEVTPQSG